MNNHYQLLVIGAGPAGLAAATTAASHGISCAVVDEQPAVGGQIYRSIETIDEQRAEKLGDDYRCGEKLIKVFRQSAVEYYPETHVWSLNNQRQVGLTHQGQSRIITADQILVATGAMERPVPFPGWTLPGVMQAGAGQILFKSAGVVPADGVVLAGSGPLLLLLAWQYMRSGVKINALLEMTPIKNYLFALPKIPKALLAFQYLLKGLSLQRDIKKAGIKTFLGMSDLKAVGNERLQSVSFQYKNAEHSIETDLLLVHFGVIPHIWLTQAAGCEHFWDNRQLCWRPVQDKWGHTSVNGIIVAGDGAGIHGARSAEFAGRLSALQALCALDVITEKQRDHKAVNDWRAIRSDRHIRPFLEAYYALPEKLLATVDNQTIVCRCEEITAGQIRAAVKAGHRNSNDVKFMTRCGMGPCQGRQCALAVAHIIEHAGGDKISDEACFRGRPPVSPLTLEHLAGLSEEDAGEL